MKKSQRERVEMILVELSDILSILPFERKLGFSRGNIYKFLKYNRKLNKTEIQKIDNYFQKIIDKYLGLEDDYSMKR